MWNEPVECGKEKGIFKMKSSVVKLHLDSRHSMTYMAGFMSEFPIKLLYTRLQSRPLRPFTPKPLWTTKAEDLFPICHGKCTEDGNVLLKIVDEGSRITQSKPWFLFEFISRETVRKEYEKEWKFIKMSNITALLCPRQAYIDSLTNLFFKKVISRCICYRTVYHTRLRLEISCLVMHRSGERKFYASFKYDDITYTR